MKKSVETLINSKFTGTPHIEVNHFQTPIDVSDVIDLLENYPHDYNYFTEIPTGNNVVALSLLHDLEEDGGYPFIEFVTDSTNSYSRSFDVEDHRIASLPELEKDDYNEQAKSFQIELYVWIRDQLSK